mmetsp:Transcript_802/g.1699  ORF Transcript_802/g.1699 Transcript_802/m.1699 type:complete len:387 (+) Transcript_802:1045-2205(+)
MAFGGSAAIAPAALRLEAFLDPAPAPPAAAPFLAGKPPDAAAELTPRGGGAGGAGKSVLCARLEGGGERGSCNRAWGSACRSDFGLRLVGIAPSTPPGPLPAVESPAGPPPDVALTAGPLPAVAAPANVAGDGGSLIDAASGSLVFAAFDSSADAGVTACGPRAPPPSSPSLLTPILPRAGPSSSPSPCTFSSSSSSCTSSNTAPAAPSSPGLKSSEWQEVHGCAAPGSASQRRCAADSCMEGVLLVWGMAGWGPTWCTGGVGGRVTQPWGSGAEPARAPNALVSNDCNRSTPDSAWWPLSWNTSRLSSDDISPSSSVGTRRPSPSGVHTASRWVRSSSPQCWVLEAAGSTLSPAGFSPEPNAPRRAWSPAPASCGVARRLYSSKP